MARDGAGVALQPQEMGDPWHLEGRSMCRVKDDIFSVVPVEREPAIQVTLKFSECLLSGGGRHTLHREKESGVEMRARFESRASMGWLRDRRQVI